MCVKATEVLQQLIPNQGDNFFRKCLALLLSPGMGKMHMNLCIHTLTRKFLILVSIQTRVIILMY
jgi:hypothetical protein